MGHANAESTREVAVLVRRHLALGWILLLTYLSLGLLLDTLHGFKVRWYLDLNNETRRLMFTLAHAHGVLMGLIHIAFAATVYLSPLATKHRSLAATCLMASGLLLPAGFLLGGVVIYHGDPGVGVLLTPVGGLLLFASVAITVRGLFHARAGA